MVREKMVRMIEIVLRSGKVRRRGGYCELRKELFDKIWSFEMDNFIDSNSKRIMSKKLGWDWCDGFEDEYEKLEI